MINGKKVVVVMPAYNAEATLERTYNELPFNIVDDVILVDDCSSDNTFEMAKKIGIDHVFWHKNNKALLSKSVEVPVLPKKGRSNKEETKEQQKNIFKKLRNKHSAVESNINELEHRGLNRCPDKGYRNYKRYIGLAVCAYNLRKIGEELIVQERKCHLTQAA